MMGTQLKTLPSGLKQVLKDDSGLEVWIYYLECLAQATYIIAHEDSALVVDPRRDIDAFMDDLSKANKTVKGILETHFHADFVSGHFEMMKKTTSPIYFGPTAGPRCQFPHHELTDGEMIGLSSRFAVKVLHTPGHTTESVVYLVVDKKNNNRPLKAFTGDTLFIGSCGRPDLVGSVGFTSEQMSKMMFSSLNEKICSLPDDVMVFPAHGAGSPCGKNLSSDLFSTIGKEKKTNPALQFEKEEEFVRFLTEGQPTAPGYFTHDVHQNTVGAEPIAEQLGKIPRVNASDFKTLVDSGKHILIDTRAATVYNRGHINGAWNFPLGTEGGAVVKVEDGNFSMWVGTLVDYRATILLIGQVDRLCESLQRLARIGYSNVAAVLEGGMESWVSANYPVTFTERLDLARQRSSDGLIEKLAAGYQLLDVRTAGEHTNNTAKNAVNIPLAELNKRVDELDKSKKYISFCSSGYRSVIGASLLRSKGFDVLDVYGGFAAISVYAPNLTTSEAVCPSMKAMIEKMEDAPH